MDKITFEPVTVSAFIPTPISLRADQREWLEQEARKKLPRNRSAIVQAALDHYRKHLEVERAMAANGRGTA
ncbi:MAG: hypothetical protein H0U59_07605 [Gemmatimonadaceae bacterium]|nr:hypothetical protein [Gemmatimonadaceae bacterium]